MSDAATAAPAAPAASSPSPAPSASPSPAPTATSTPAPAAPAAAEPKAPAAAPEPKPEPRRFKVKVDGQELELPEEEVLRGYQRAAAAQRRFDEVSRLKKEIEEREAAMKARYQDPRIAALKQRDPSLTDDDALAVIKAQELFERQQMSPEQRALADERKRREELESKLKAEEEAKAQAAEQAELRVHTERLNKSIPEAAKKIGLPATPRAGKIMLEHMLSMAKAGIPPDPVDAAQYAHDTLRAESSALLRDMSDDQVVKFLGPDVVKRINAYSVAQVRGQTQPAPAPQAEAPKPKEPPRMLTPAEWRAKYAG